MTPSDLYVINCIQNNKRISGKYLKSIGNKSLTDTELYSIGTNTPIPLCICGKHVNLITFVKGYRKYCSVDCNRRVMRNRNIDMSNKIQQKLLANGKKSYDDNLEKWQPALNYYMNNNLSIKYVSSIYNINYQSLKNMIHKENILNKNKKDNIKNKMENVNKVIDDNINDFLHKKYSSVMIADIVGCSKNYVVTYLRGKNIKLKNNSVSSQEFKVRSFLDSLNIKYKCNIRSVINKELDIYIEAHNLAIEINGIYWHDNKCHREKFVNCNNKNIRLLQFTDMDINHRFDIVCSIIKYNLNLIDNKINARDCTITNIDESVYKKFIKQNSIYEFKKCDSYSALYHNDIIVYVIGYTNNNVVDILPLKYTVIRGGFNRLIKYSNCNNITIDSMIFSNKTLKSSYITYEDFITYYSKKNYKADTNGYIYNSSGLYKITINP